MELTFTRACMCDWQTVRSVRDRAFYADFERFGHCPGYARPKERVIGGILCRDEYLIYWGREAVGDLCVRHDPGNVCHLGSLCVVPEYQGRGIGTQAIAFMLRRFADASAYTLDTPADKAENRRFYERAGFRAVAFKEDGGVRLVDYELRPAPSPNASKRREPNER